MPTQIGKQIASRNETEKLVAVHDNGDAPAIEYSKQIINFCIWRQRFQLVSHGLPDFIIKMRGVAMHFYQDVRFVDDANDATTFVHHRQLLDVRLAHAFETSEQRIGWPDGYDFARFVTVQNQIA